MTMMPDIPELPVGGTIRSAIDEAVAIAAEISYQTDAGQQVIAGDTVQLVIAALIRHVVALQAQAGASGITEVTHGPTLTGRGTPGNRIDVTTPITPAQLAKLDALPVASQIVRQLSALPGSAAVGDAVIVNGVLYHRTSHSGAQTLTLVRGEDPELGQDDTGFRRGRYGDLLDASGDHVLWMDDVYHDDDTQGIILRILSLTDPGAMSMVIPVFGTIVLNSRQSTWTRAATGRYEYFGQAATSPWPFIYGQETRSTFTLTPASPIVYWATTHLAQIAAWAQAGSTADIPDDQIPPDIARVSQIRTDMEINALITAALANFSPGQGPTGGQTAQQVTNAINRLVSSWALASDSSDIPTGRIPADIARTTQVMAAQNAAEQAASTALSAHEGNASGHRTPAQIKAAYEGLADTNAFTDTEKALLATLHDPSSATTGYVPKVNSAAAGSRAYELAADETGSGGTALTAAEIKTRYESNPNTNAFTDHDRDKLADLSQAGRQLFTFTLVAGSSRANEFGSANPSAGFFNDTTEPSWQTAGSLTPQVWTIAGTDHSVYAFFDTLEDDLELYIAGNPQFPAGAVIQLNDYHLPVDNAVFLNTVDTGKPYGIFSWRGIHDLLVSGDSYDGAVITGLNDYDYLTAGGPGYAYRESADVANEWIETIPGTDVAAATDDARGVIRLSDIPHNSVPELVATIPRTPTEGDLHRIFGVKQWAKTAKYTASDVGQSIIQLDISPDVDYPGSAGTNIGSINAYPSGFSDSMLEDRTFLITGGTVPVNAPVTGEINGTEYPVNTVPTRQHIYEIPTLNPSDFPAGEYDIRIHNRTANANANAPGTAAVPANGEIGIAHEETVIAYEGEQEWTYSALYPAPWARQGAPEPVDIRGRDVARGFAVGVSPNTLNAQTLPGAPSTITPDFDLDDNAGFLMGVARRTFASRSATTIGFTVGDSNVEAGRQTERIFLSLETEDVPAFDGNANNAQGLLVGAGEVYDGATLLGESSLKAVKTAAGLLQLRVEFARDASAPTTLNWEEQWSVDLFFVPTGDTTPTPQPGTAMPSVLTKQVSAADVGLTQPSGAQPSDWATVFTHTVTQAEAALGKLDVRANLRISVAAGSDTAGNRPACAFRIRKGTVTEAQDDKYFRFGAGAQRFAQIVADMEVVQGDVVTVQAAMFTLTAATTTTNGTVHLGSSWTRTAHQ